MLADKYIVPYPSDVSSSFCMLTETKLVFILIVNARAGRKSLYGIDGLVVALVLECRWIEEY